MKIAIVTGGSRGLGKNTALKIAQKGSDVIITYRSQKEEADSVVNEIQKLGRKAVALQLDVGDTRSFEGFTAEVRKALKANWNTDKFDYLVNNAGMGIHATIPETTEEQFDQLMNVHFKGPFFLTQKLLPMMNDNGRIVNLSSGLSRFALPGYAVYASLKGAMEVMTHYMAKEFGSRGITANIVAPGAIETDFGGGRVRDNKDMNQWVASNTAMGRAGVPDDIGGAIASLLSEDNRWVTAQRIEISGGMLI
jgi:Dehydrogenases with different specificities (related to short-chain alcohol dehydrogenases)